MNISEADVEKIKIITVSAQVNDLVVLLSNIDKESLLTAINAIQPENQNSISYRFLLYALDFFEKIEEELDQRELDEKLQMKFDYENEH